LESGLRAVGMRLATGGLGPRLEVVNEAGDAVRLGRNIGTLRLGGWCDLYLPSDVAVIPRPGQTLVCAETVIGRFGGAAADLFERDDEVEVPAVAETEVAEDEPVEAELVIDEEDELTLEELAGENSSSDDDEEEDVSEMFARLRNEAKKIQDED